MPHLMGIPPEVRDDIIDRALLARRAAPPDLAFAARTAPARRYWDQGRNYQDIENPSHTSNALPPLLSKR